MKLEDRFYKNMPREYKRFLRGMVPEMGEEEFERFYRSVKPLKHKNILPPLKYLKHFETFINDKDLFYEFMKHSYNQNEHKTDEENAEWEAYLIRRSGLSREQYKSNVRKYKAIEKVVSNRLFSSFERNLAVVQAILDGEWEVEKSMTLDEFKEEYKLLKCEYNRLRVVGNLSATRIHQEAVTKLVEEFLEEVE